MVVLGIDPGYAIVGYGAIEYCNGIYHVMGYGAIETSAQQKFDVRLEQIYNEMNGVIDRSKPDVLSIEKLYFQNNQKTAIDVAQARGVILLSARQKGIPIYEYTPLEVKTAVTGYGQAKKPQVMKAIKSRLKLEQMPRLDDTADALAIAMCYIQYNGTMLKKYLNQL